MRAHHDGSIACNPSAGCFNHVLQQQVNPLEAVIESLSMGVDDVVVLGDFNRDLSYEAARV